MNEHDFLQLQQRVEQLEKQVEFLKKDEKRIQQNNITRVKPKQEVIPKEPKVKKDWEKIIGQVWLPRIFIFILLLGVVWGFKVAVDMGFITESVRVILGFISAIGLLWYGNKQVKQDRKTFGLVLISGSIALVMLTTFAAHVLYGFIPFTIALILNVVWISSGIYLSHHYQSQALGVLVGIAGFLVPFLLENESHNDVLFVSYIVLLYSSFLYYSLKKKYVVLYHTSNILLQVVFIIYLSLNNSYVEEHKFLTIGILIQHMLILITILKEKNYLKQQLGTLYSSFVLTAMWYGNTFEEIYSFFILLALLYSILSILYYKQEETKERTSFFISISFISISLFFMAKLELESNSFLFLLGTIGLYVGLKLKLIIQKITSILIYMVGIVMLLDNWIDTLYSKETLSWVLFLITLYCIKDLFTKFASTKDYKQYKGTMLLVPSFINVVYPLIFLVFISQITLVLAEGLEDTQQMILSFVWAIYSIILSVYGIKKDIKRLRIGGLIFIFVTLFKLFFFDLPTVSILIRAILFMGIGSIGILMSRFFYKKN